MSDPLEQSLALLRELQAIAQNGLTFAKDPFDRDRYLRLRQIVEQRVPSTLDAEVVLGAEKGYITPKAEVRAAAFRDGRILMVREISDGLWTLPGGWADVNQTPAEAVVKEVWEESGFQARATKLAAVWDRRRHAHPPSFHHAYKLFFLCDLIGGEAKGSIETSEVGFFPEADLPPLSVHRVTAEQIRTMFRHERQRDLPTEFD